jgi:two-component system nitrogen regulation response regulator NtrX
LAIERKRVLVVDDEPDVRLLLGQVLTDFGYVITEAHDASAARTAVRLEQFDAILLDVWMPGDDGITLLKQWKEANMQTPVVMLSAHGSIEIAIEATRYGAYDYLEKPVGAGRLEITMRNAVSKKARRVVTTDSELNPLVKTKLIGSSVTMKFLRRQIKDVAATKANVLIVGEPGTGKSTLARMIHEASGNSDAPLIVLDWVAGEGMGTPVSELLDAVKNGTLLIRDLQVYDGFNQGRILGLLNKISSEYSDAGESTKPRVIATASPTIKTKLESGQLTPELYYRLNNLTIEMPALREHPEDIPELVGYMSDQFNQKENIQYKRVSTAALNSLRNHEWPGNVQELKSVLLRAILMRHDETITNTDIESLLEHVYIVNTDNDSEIENGAFWYSLSLRDAKDQFERDYLIHNLKQCNTYTETAKSCGLHRSSLFRKIREHGIKIVPGGNFEGNEANEESE